MSLSSQVIQAVLWSVVAAVFTCAGIQFFTTSRRRVQRAFPYVSSNEQNEEVLHCPIRLEPTNDPAILDVCGHIFERSAIEEWLSIRPICPTCKRPATYNNIRRYRPA